MEFPIPLPLLEVLIFVFISGAGFFLVPFAFKSYLKWRETMRPRDFSSTVFQGALSLCLLVSAFPSFASRIIELHASSPMAYKLVAYMAFGGLLGYWTLPKMLLYYQRLKTKKTPAHFTWMIFFGILSFYGLSVLFIVTLNSAIAVTR